MFKWKKRYEQWVCEKDIPGWGTFYGEINTEIDDEEKIKTYSLEMENMDNDLIEFDYVFYDIESLKEAKIIAEKEVRRVLNCQIKKIQKFLKAK